LPVDEQKCLESQVNANRNLLQDLGMHAIKGRAFCFQDGKGRLLLVECQAFACLFIGIFACLQQVVIEPTTFFKGLVELVKLSPGWV
jgi:hypothetical protein